MTKPPRGRLPDPDNVEWDRESEQPILGEGEDTTPFNPLDTKNLAIAVTKALLEKTARRLDALSPFRGAGIYAIYYSGPFPAYRPIAAENPERQHPKWPIYVGKAIPPGGRRGAFNLAATDTTALFGRLREHAESVTAAENLRVQDFSCRFLVVQDLWIPLAEGLLISHFAPVWNTLVDGFGNHDPGSGRYNGLRPRWDVLHPGRAWAIKCKPRSESEADIQREVSSYLAGAAVPSLGTLSGELGGK
jgi:hypothetical protein